MHISSKKGAVLLAALLLSATPGLAQNSAASGKAADSSKTASAPSKGHAIAIAGDCAGCHASPNGSSEYAGGMALATPMGTMYARNITPDGETGIGGWSLRDFDQAVRYGKSKRLGHLYPAMPYTSYVGMTDEDVKALYDYFMMEVKPIRNPVPETKLGFPFVRPAMIVWNLLFAGGKPQRLANATPEVLRGQYLVDVLGHCGECHTPRGMMFQTSTSQHLAGAPVGGWYAPNITPDASGLGGWSVDDLKDFLVKGKHKDAIAGGDMGLAVELSLARLPDSDIAAIVSYLRATPAMKSMLASPVQAKVGALDLAAVEPINKNAAAFYDASSTDGAVLYVAACATCHGIDGALKKGAGPSLVNSGAVRAKSPANVVQAITSGINLRGLDTETLMPSFKSQLNEAQIASVASYVRNRFGGIPEKISASEVKNIVAGRIGVPWLIRNAVVLAWLGVVAGAVALIGLGVYLMRRSRGAAA